ncbi:putative membrane protein [Paraburkholderia fungorum]|uniref:Membrane protein n=2 Tax=Paraburkholderia fungorum TaxID=134537 RepID=A0AAU8TEP4_9BURK|nr:putative membrane protein [Paraburkholderia fungorum]
MSNSKLASVDSQMKRGTASAKAFLFLFFVGAMSVPILNMLAGMGFFIWFSVNIYARSAQRGADYFWLIVGSILCLVGIGLPAIADMNHSSFVAGWVVEVVLNVCVCLFIAVGRLGHLFQRDPEPGQ